MCFACNFFCGIFGVFIIICYLCVSKQTDSQVKEKDNIIKAAYITLGCKLNFAETSSLSDVLAERGVERVAEGERADICVINTCSVTETSNHKCRQAISRAMRENPGAMGVVMGCYAQLAGKQLA